MIRYNNLTVRSHQMMMEDTQDIRGNKKLSKPVSRDTDKPTAHVTLYMRVSKAQGS